MKPSLRCFILCMFFIVCGALQAMVPQNNVLRDDIRTLRTEIGGELSPMPVLQLHSQEQVVVSFDQLSHEGRRFFYRIQHCNFDWQPADGLFLNEFMESNQDEVWIDKGIESQNTTTLYTHYRFHFPSAEAKPLLSGNYLLTIYDDSSENPEAVAEVRLRMVEPLVSITGRVLTNTDIDWNAAHQQLEMEVKAERLAGDLRSGIRTIVLQNGRSDNAAVAIPPTAQMGNSLLWKHAQGLIFEAGNEYRRFELLSVRTPGLRVQQLQWFPPYYHATLAEDEMRRSYLVQGDRNGTAVIRNTDNGDANTESDYVLTHFTLEGEEIPNASVFVNGQWSYGSLTPDYQLHYHAERRAYEGVVLLKQGYYNYIYLTRSQKTQNGSTAATEGNFYQTTNDYTILVYARLAADRYDRLVGVATLKS